MFLYHNNIYFQQLSRTFPRGAPSLAKYMRKKLYEKQSYAK
ncbi:hypothetical protein B4168_3282 [Anoxybacillus flavithermus]|nr:hypothetical protein B4168_3282 [Anoxybacillus flavithermus]OAO85147.1 hypothetical protein GT23_3201 [Parageobacillus thermoglucosidasius]